MLTPATLPALQAAIADSGLDGWLLFDFQRCNPIAAGLIDLDGMVTRRVFAWVPRDGKPVAVTHAIEQLAWRRWPAEWSRVKYAGWRALEAEIARLVGGKRIAMEYSAGDAVMYVDRVPAGVLELVRNAGATVLPSGDLVSRFYATWTPEHLAAHRRAAETIARIARDAFSEVGRTLGEGRTLTEYQLHRWILERFARAGLETDHGPNVSLGANAANPHYEPTEQQSATLARGQVLLIDLWARETAGGPYADQTWMGALGAPGDEERKVWEAIRDGRDAAIEFLRGRLASGATVRGAEADDAARDVIAARGYGEWFTHRTGHSIDSRQLHGSGPHLDNYETREERVLVPGVGFSIEPGVYLPGRFGMRTEVNGFVGADGLLVTPDAYQRELIVI
jgi:Xaa-Pro dipeptidase